MDELTPAQLQELEANLRAQHEEMRTMLGAEDEVSQPVEPDSAIGRISRLDAIQMQQMAQANRRTTMRRLQQTKAALQRVANETYGECAECGHDIGYPRLKARPEAPFCLDCQSRREHRA